MIKWKQAQLAALLVILSAGWLPRQVIAQSPDTVARVVAAVNADRVANGLPPYQLNSLLTLAAQRHSEYQASIGQWTHSSPDGGRTLQRVQATGYPATRANENVYSGHVSPEEAANWWYTADADHRNNVLHPAMREIGVGAAADSRGVIYYTMDISAQPNVLPVFINSGAYSTSDASVTLTLTNEYIFPARAGRIGQASQVMISNSADFGGTAPQSWAQTIPWTLDTSTGGGQKTVYVRYIDGGGRTADSQATVLLDASGAAAPPPPQPTAAPIVTTTAPVAPTSAPAAAPVQPVKPQPTAVPPQPTRIPPTSVPAAITPTAALVAMKPAAPTLDFSNSQYMRAQRGEIVTADLAEDTQTAGLLSELSLRQFLWVALMLGIAAIVVGILRLRAFRRAQTLVKETSPDGDG